MEAGGGGGHTRNGVEWEWLGEGGVKKKKKGQRSNKPDAVTEA